jgi:hypothetical protein
MVVRHKILSPEQCREEMLSIRQTTFFHSSSSDVLWVEGVRMRLARVPAMRKLAAVFPSSKIGVGAVGQRKCLLIWGGLCLVPTFAVLEFEGGRKDNSE